MVRMKLRALWHVVAATALAVMVVVSAIVVWLRHDDPVPRFSERRGRIATVTLDSATVERGHIVQGARVYSTSGVALDLLIKRPAHGRPGPLVVLLGGHATGRSAARLVPDTRGRVVVALSYPYAGPHRMNPLEVLRWAPAIRRGLLDAPPAVQIALDYLLAQPYIDRREVHGMGASLGTPFMTVAAAIDPRITHVWSVHGAGNSRAMLTHNAKESVPDVLAPLTGFLADVLVAGPYLSPERWVGQVSPRPFHMINATADERLPRHTIMTLYDAAAEPKSLTWLPGLHVQRNRPEVVRGLVSAVFDRMDSETLPGDR
ncbi:MAG: hypothetical protein V4617_18595 [Gemmatimonadota bacterium]